MIHLTWLFIAISALGLLFDWPDIAILTTVTAASISSIIDTRRKA